MLCAGDPPARGDGVPNADARPKATRLQHCSSLALTKPHREYAWRA